MDSKFDYKSDSKFLADKEEQKQYLLHRLSCIWYEQMMELSDFDKVKLFGNANELELCLIYMFDVTLEEINKIREAERERVAKFCNKKQ